MSQPMRRRPVIKKRAKPLAEVHKTLMHQSIKLISKTVKLVKAFLIQKCTRKITELKESNGDVTEELNHLADVKAVDHSVYGTVVANRMLSIGNKEFEADDIDEKILDSILKQKKVIDVIRDVEQHIKESVDKNNDRRAKEQSSAAKQAKKAKNLLERRTLSVKDRTEAVFLDTLQAPEEKPVDAVSKKKQKELERVKIEKSLRNKQNRLKNKAAKGGDASSDGGRPNKKRKFSNRSTDSASNHDDASLSVYGPGSGSGADGASKRRHSADSNSAPPFKNHKSAAPVVVAAAPSAEKLEQIASSGKDWKEAGLHPSWAAKQLSKKTAPLVIAAGASAGQGKKITFD